MSLQTGRGTTPEPAWLARARTGDREAFAHLYREHYAFVYRYLLCRTRDRHLAEDLTQEVFARALRGIGGFAWRGTDPVAWLTTIARNLHLDEVGRSRTRWETLVPEFRDPEQPDKGRFYNCVIGWQCELVNGVKLHAYELDDDLTNFRSGTGVALAAELEGAYRRGDPWLGYYWGPTWVLGQLDLYMLEEPPFTQECWDAFTALVDRPEEATFACAYPTSTAEVGIGSRFLEDAPDMVRSFLDAYHGNSAMLSRALAYMHARDATPDEAARNFLATEPDVWRQWLDAEAADRVAAAFGTP